MLPLYSLKAGEWQRHPHKVHAVDLGLRNAVCLSETPDRGRLCESAVHGALVAGRHDGLHYWRRETELDLVVSVGNRVGAVVQVAAEGLERREVLARELRSLERAAEVFPHARRLLVVDRLPAGDPGPQMPPGVELVPLWRGLHDDLSTWGD